ncbi:cysteine hydrolase family protein [Aspergillus mulundensis]|uniref:Isochorismatase-like domain-containing protein n=1 Tax=Aspergillus mulundensis TaxID=1810919 RepID=A0A3D8QRD8_9EURO|nr:Uncharacterized protein DSM5745_09794 [Aspergillus mulundensis]RDW64383.1 Uncharacterized protein DSM5745_09794 [Aspergillus mulundensis]
MSTPRTAIILIDPYNDFLHPNGKLTPLIQDLDERNTIQHLKDVVGIARANQLPIYYGLHQQWAPGRFKDWRHMAPNHVRQEETHYFEDGSFGAQIYKGLEPDPSNGDVVVSKHWNSNSFQNTDLEYQLRQRNIEKLVFAGLTANTCLESTARHAFELGYKVTILKDATAGFSRELTSAGELVWPLFASVSTVGEWEEGLEAKKNT